MRILSDKLGYLEDQVREKEDRLSRSSNEILSLKNDLEIQRTRNRDQDIELNSLRIKVENLQSKVDNVNKENLDLDTAHKEDYRKIQDL